jgi:ferric-dicitrate binding protein FerR (iron transport regulator)
VIPEDLVAFLDGELSPAEQESIERDLSADPVALAILRELCRQRLMLAERWASPAAAPPLRWGPRFRVRWQVFVATLLFAASIMAVWLGRDAEPRVVRGTLLVSGAPVRSAAVGELLVNPGPTSAELRLREGALLTLLPGASAVLRHAPEFVELVRGAALLRVSGGTGEVRVDTRSGTMMVRGSEFTVELVPGPDLGGQSMDSLLALVVSVLGGQAQVEAAGKAQVVVAGESRVFGVNGAVADTLASFLAAQDEKEKKDDEKKEGEGKEKKGRKKDKKEGKEKKEKEDDDRDEKGGKGKKDKDDDDKEEKGGKNKEKGKKD